MKPPQSDSCQLVGCFQQGLAVVHIMLCWAQPGSGHGLSSTCSLGAKHSVKRGGLGVVAFEPALEPLAPNFCQLAG